MCGWTDGTGKAFYGLCQMRRMNGWHTAYGIRCTASTETEDPDIDRETERQRVETVHRPPCAALLTDEWRTAAVGLAHAALLKCFHWLCGHLSPTLSR